MKASQIEARPLAVTGPRLRAEWLLLAGFCWFLFFFGLAYFGLIGADEPRYAQVAREMLERHDWITPTLGGKAWLEKPVLYYWQAMIAYRIFGVSDWAARLPSALDATLMVFAIYVFLRRFRPGSELDGALITASAAGVIGFARAASMDMPLAAMFCIALLAWYGFYETKGHRYLAAFYFFIALGTLAKGPLAPFLAALMIVIFAAVRREFGLIRRTLWFPGILIFCAVALPWFVAVQIRNPEFFRVFILQHNLARFGSNLYHHIEPFWYYLPVTLIALIPWTAFVILAIAEVTREWREKTTVALNQFLLIWLIVPVVFFSASQSKLPGYILPAIPAGTLLVSEYVRRRVEQKNSAEMRPELRLAIAHSLVAVWPIVPAMMLQYIIFQHRFIWSKAAAISVAFATVMGIGIVFSLRSKHGLRMFRPATLLAVVITVAAALRIGAPALESALSARPVAEEISNFEKAPLPLAVFRISRETEYGLDFYRNEIIPRYELGQIPAEEHLVLAPERSATALARKLPGRHILYLGSFAAQKIDYFLVSAAGQ